MSTPEQHVKTEPATVHPFPSRPPWDAVVDYIPKGFVITRAGVFIDKNDPEFICGPCWVAAMTRSTQGTDWGIVAHWIDQDGNEQSSAFPVRKLSESRSPLAGDLASLGLKVVPGKERRLMEYLGSFSLPDRRRSVSQLGWIEGEDGSPHFVLPDRTIGLGETENVVFQPEKHSSTIRTMHQSGSLEQWKSFVAAPCAGNPILVFSLCTAFSGPLLKYAGLDCGGFHFFGASSRGKTTALQVAATVWGSGADPSVSEDSYICRWNTTGNALEATAAAHNDGLLTLDEMGTCDARDFGKVIYDLFGGKGKSRLDKNSTLQAQRTWRLLGLSSGEISVRQKIEEDSGRQARTGQLIRLADIPISGGVIDTSHGQHPGDFVNQLKKACGRTYGTAGPRFLEKLVNLDPESSGIRSFIHAEIDDWEKDLADGKDLESHQRRVIQRFATVVTAGILAARFDILGLPESEIVNAVFAARDAWLGDEGNKPEAVRGMEKVREFILKNPGRFRPRFDETVLVRDLAGYVDQNQGLYLFTKSGFTEACSGFPTPTVLEEIDRFGFLLKTERDRKVSRHIIDSNRLGLYAVKSRILDDEI